MLKQMMAEIIFRNPGDMNPAIADLIGFDFEVRILDDWIDDDGPAVWILATTLSGLNQSAFFHSVRAIAEPQRKIALIVKRREAGTVGLREQKAAVRHAGIRNRAVIWPCTSNLMLVVDAERPASAS